MKNHRISIRSVVSLCVPALLVLSGCASLTVDSEWNHEADFASFTSYAWIPQTEGPASDQQLPKHLDLRLRRVVDDILIDDKGLDKAPSPAQADLLLAYYIDTEKGLRVDYSVYSGYYGGYGYGYWPGYHGGPGYYGGTSVQHVREYTTGSLVLDIVDRKSKVLVWTGVVKGEPKYKNPSGERVASVMTKMLEDFPPPR